MTTISTALQKHPALRAFAVFVIAATAAGAVALSMSPAIAGPRHVCPPGQYMKIPPRNQMSDLHGGAITQWLQKCYLVR